MPSIRTTKYTGSSGLCCYSFISSSIELGYVGLTLINLNTVDVFDRSLYISFVIPLECIDMMACPILIDMRSCLGTTTGAKVELRSRGTFGETTQRMVFCVLRLKPLQLLLLFFGKLADALYKSTK